MDKKETSEVKGLESTIGNSTKIPGVDEDEDMVKAEKQTTKAVKIDKVSVDDEAFVSPEIKRLLADAEDDDKGTDRKVNYAFIARMEVDRAQREERKRLREENKSKMT